MKKSTLDIQIFYVKNNILDIHIFFVKNSTLDIRIFYVKNSTLDIIKVLFIHQLIHQWAVLKAILKFTLKQLRHFSVQLHHHQGGHSFVLTKVTTVTSVSTNNAVPQPTAWPILIAKLVNITHLLYLDWCQMKLCAEDGKSPPFLHPVWLAGAVATGWMESMWVGDVRGTYLHVWLSSFRYCGCGDKLWKLQLVTLQTLPQPSHRRFVICYCVCVRACASVIGWSRISFGLLVTEDLWVNLQGLLFVTPIPEAARSRAWVYGRSLAAIAGSNSVGVIDVCPLWVLCVVR